MSSENVKIFGIAKWRLVPDEPRHNTWHNALYDSAKDSSVNLDYIGLRNTFKTDWITQILPDSILKQFPYIGPSSFNKVLKIIRGSEAQKTLVYIFEGTIFWLFFLWCIRSLIPNCLVICNLFSSTLYDRKFFKANKVKIRYRWFFKFLNHCNPDNFLITFDTQLMADKANMITGCNFKKFPVPASFEFKPFSSFDEKAHHKVLVNMRGFSDEELHLLLENSCKLCTFVFPRGSLGSESLKYRFGRYINANFDEKVVPVSEWKDYIDSFDYMIFLYMPTVFPATNISGRILDAVVRSIPVCVPSQLSECADIASKWGRANLFDCTSLGSLQKTFDHPVFTSLINFVEPPFTPAATVKKLFKLVKNKKVSKIKFYLLKSFLISLVLVLHSIISIILSFIFQLRVKIMNSILYKN